MATKVEVNDDAFKKAMDSIDDVIKSCAVGKEETKEDNKEKKDEEMSEKSEATEATAEVAKAEVAKVQTATFEAEVMKSDAVKQSVEVSDFLSEIVKSISASIDSLTSEINKSVEAQNQGLVKQQEQTLAIAKSMQSLSSVVEDLAKRQTEIEKQPLGVKKSVTAVAVERDFNKSEKSEKSLSKGEVSNKLTDLLMKSETINGTTVSLNDISKFEASGQLRPELHKALFG